MDESESGGMELFARLRDGDEMAFDAIFREWYGPLVQLAYIMLRDRGAAEEVVQELMLALWRRREQLDIHESPRAYLVRATRSRALNHLRQRRRWQRRVDDAVDDAPTAPVADARLVDSELDAAVRQAVAGLPPRCREVFELSRVRGLRYGEIAEVLGISAKTVEAQMGKALRLLREHRVVAPRDSKITPRLGAHDASEGL